MSVDLSRLSPTGRAWYERLDAVFREEIGRRLPDTWTADDAHKAAWIAVQTADPLMRASIDDAVAKRVKVNPAEEVAEVLFDVAHEGCDEVCTGGGRPWYDGPAKKLTDPFSAVTAIAVEHQMLIDELDDVAKEAGDDLGWLNTLRAQVATVGSAMDAQGGDEAEEHAVRREVLQLGAWCAAFVEEIDRRADEATARKFAAASETEVTA